MDEHPQSDDSGAEQVHSTRRVTRRHLLKVSAAGALGVGAASLLGVAGASAAAETIFAAPLLAGGQITVLVSSGNGTAVRALGDSYTSHTGTTVEVLELPYDQTFQKLQITLSQGADAYDVASLDDPWIPQFAGNRFLVNLDEMFLNAGLTVNDQFHPQLLALGDWPRREGLRALPWLGNVQVFAWRSDLIANRPNTWDEVVATAQAIKGGSSGEIGYAIP